MPLSIEVDACGEDGSSPSGVLLIQAQNHIKNHGGVSCDKTRVHSECYDIWLNNIDNNASMRVHLTEDVVKPFILSHHAIHQPLGVQLFYYRDGSFDYTSVDGDFASYKHDVLDWCDEDASVFDEDEDEADTTTHIFDPFEDDILDLEDDYLVVAVESDTGSGKCDDDELQDDEHSPEEILELLMTHFQYTKTE